MLCFSMSQYMSSTHATPDHDTHDSKNVRAVDMALDATSSGSPIFRSGSPIILNESAPRDYCYKN